MTARDVILTCAVTGGGDTVGKSPCVPVTPEQIADSALAAAEAGASIVHLHVRDPQTGKPSMDQALYARTVELIRADNEDLLINLTTGAGARLVPSRTVAGKADPGTMMATPADRVAHVTALKPALCSLDIATMNFGAHAFINTPSHLRDMAAAIDAAGVTPELEVFDLGHIRLARALIEEGALPQRHLFQLCLGVPWGAAADVETLTFMADRLPEKALWSAFGIGAQQFPMLRAVLDLGGHVRVGLEDNLYIRRGELAQSNAQLVSEAVRLITDRGDQVASPAHALSILKGAVYA
ncbi:MAG: 3-keto-5-aminohexanoate cleavage protein [Pseudomonadota bacterium]